MDIYPMLMVRKIYSVKMALLPKAIYRFIAIPIKVLSSIFQETETNSSQIHMLSQKILTSQNNPEKENKSEGITIPDVKL